MQTENETQTNDGTHKRNPLAIDTRQISEYIGKKYVIHFFYPLDFTFVCPTGEFDTELCDHIRNLINKLIIAGSTIYKSLL